MQIDYSQWQPAIGATDELRDQQKDLTGGYWAEIGPDERHQPGGWSWTILIGSDGEGVADGYVADEAAAKAAVDAWEPIEDDGCTCCQVSTESTRDDEDECLGCGHLMKSHYRTWACDAS